MKIAVIFCSRGLAFSQTCDELLENLEGFNYDVFFSHGVDAPECYDEPIAEALRGSYTHFWVVDDDIVLPHGILKLMIKELGSKEAIYCEGPINELKIGCLFSKRSHQVHPRSTLVCSMRCGRRVLKALGQAGTNNGEHDIKVLT